jgi:hypothetical protein
MKQLYTLRWVLMSALLAGCGVESQSNVEQAPATQAGAAVEAPRAATYAEQAEPVLGQIDESAVAILKEMAGNVAGLQAFTLTLESGFDVLQESGQKFEFGSRRTATILRPDRARFTYEERTGAAGQLTFDGSAITAYEPEQNVFATIEQPGDIDASIDMVTVELGIPVPVSDFFAADPGAALADGVLEARDLGASTLDQQPGRHIALRKPSVDYQIWINESTKLPIRVVITYHEEPGQPQFWAQFLSWDTATGISEDSFEFSPPDGAERIRFGVFDTSEDSGGET